MMSEQPSTHSGSECCGICAGVCRVRAADDYVKGLDPLPGGEMPRPSENQNARSVAMPNPPEVMVNGKPMGQGLDGMLRALQEMVPAYGVSVGDPDVFDPDELVRWAYDYGHPEEWAKKAQSLHAANERLDAENQRLRQKMAGIYNRVDDVYDESCGDSDWTRERFMGALANINRIADLVLRERT